MIELLEKKKELLIKKRDSSDSVGMIVYLQAQIDLLIDLIKELERKGI